MKIDVNNIGKNKRPITADPKAFKLKLDFNLSCVC